ncbi:hypothetical protein AVEN_51014-2-1, partial [Araneus ventricosus]
APRGLFRDGPVISNRSQMTRTEPELAPPLQDSVPYHRKDMAATYDLEYSKSHKRRGFSGIGFRIWSPPAPRPRLEHSATTVSNSEMNAIVANEYFGL